MGLPDEVDAEVEVAGYIAPNILLPEGRWFPGGGWQIIWGVRMMVSTVEGIIDSIEAIP